MERSEFNHAWLKNRFLVALGKAQNVLVGVVEDDSIYDDIEALVVEWKERKIDAEKILRDYRNQVSPKNLFDQFPLVNLEPELREWLGTIAELRWEQTEQSHIKLTEAIKVLSAFEVSLERFSVIIPDIRSGAVLKSAAEPKLIELRTSAKNLADAFSRLA